MGVIEHAIEFIYEAACNKVFAEDNYIEKGRKRSLRENRDMELQNVLDSRLFKVFHLKEATLRVHQSSFFRLKRKLFVLRLVCLWLSMNIFVFLSLLNWHKRPYGCWTKFWTKFFIFKIQMEAALLWMPEWKSDQGTWSNEGF